MSVRWSAMPKAELFPLLVILIIHEMNCHINPLDMGIIKLQT